MKNLALICLLGIAGCEPESKITSREPVGQTIACEPVPTSFNEDLKTNIATSSGNFIVKGTHSVLRNKTATLIRYQGGEKRLWIEGEPKTWFLY